MLFQCHRRCQQCHRCKRRHARGSHPRIRYLHKGRHILLRSGHLRRRPWSNARGTFCRPSPNHHQIDHCRSLSGMPPQGPCPPSTRAWQASTHPGLRDPPCSQRCLVHTGCQPRPPLCSSCLRCSFCTRWSRALVGTCLLGRRGSPDTRRLRRTCPRRTATAPWSPATQSVPPTRARSHAWSGCGTRPPCTVGSWCLEGRRFPRSMASSRSALLCSGTWTQGSTRTRSFRCRS